MGHSLVQVRILLMNTIIGFMMGLQADLILSVSQVMLMVGSDING